MRKPALLLVASLLLLAAAGEPSPLSPSAFRDRYAAAITAATGKPTKTIDDYTFSAKAVDGTDLTIAIDNAYAAYRADPARIDAIIARYSRSVTDIGQEGKELVEQLIVIVRPTDYLKSSLPPGSSLDSFISPRPLAGDLSYFLAVDWPDSIRSAGKSDLKRWHLAEPAAWTHAIANIGLRMGSLEMDNLGGEDGATGISAASGLAPSILADPKFCGPEAPANSEGAIVLVYAKDFFLFDMPADTAITGKFWKTAKTEIAAGRSISSTPLVCRGGHWIAAPIP